MNEKQKGTKKRADRVAAAVLAEGHVFVFLRNGGVRAGKPSADGTIKWISEGEVPGTRARGATEGVFRVL